MREKSLLSIISLFSSLAAYKPGTSFSLFRNMLEVYLSTQFSSETTNAGLETFEERVSFYLSEFHKDGKINQTLFLNEVESNCYILSRELTMPQRLLILIYMLDFEPVLLGSEKSTDIKILRTVATHLKISLDDYNDCESFVHESYENVSNGNPLLVVTDNSDLSIPDVNIQSIEGLIGKIVLIRFTQLDTILFKVSGESQFVLGNNQLFKHRTYIFGKGDVIYTNDKSLISYNEVIRFFVKTEKFPVLTLDVSDVDYRFSNGTYGINKVSFTALSGELLAIMGGSGSGKTTLMNLLIGLYKPLNGSITINNVDIHKNPDKTKGYIGYVPQDDALYENLTAYQNLYFIANLSLRNLTKEERDNKVDDLLKELGLWNIKDLRVGNPLDKIISGGQRKRLNIALELIRDPGLLFLDEPTSGLSSSDSSSIMKVLREVANKGRLIVMNIHQPSSEVFKMFDKLLFIDQGGFPVYFGTSIHVVSYLKTKLRFVDAHQNECPHCGNLNPDDVFNFAQVEKIRPVKISRSKRQITPKQWHRLFLSDKDVIPKKKPVQPLEKAILNIPGIIEQFGVYFYRNLLTKTKDYPYLLLSLFLTPLLSAILSLFTRYVNPSVGYYQYYDNDNMPAFIFMSVIVALFVGIMGGASEIIKDRAALKRESFLNLSYAAYFMSKLLFLFILSGIQMFSYYIISHEILMLPQSSGLFFMTLWLTALSANAMGLLLSSFFKTMASVYIAIPFLLIPQILFSGAVIDFNKINPAFSNEKYVPLFANIMVSRWAFEGISVALFVENRYSDEFYIYNKKSAEISYYRSFLLPEMEKDFFGDSYSSSFFLTPDSSNFKLVNNGISQIETVAWDFKHSVDTIKGEPFLKYLSDVRTYLVAQNDSIQLAKDDKIDLLGNEKYNQLLKMATNKKLEEVMTDDKNLNKLIKEDNSYIRKLYPIYFGSNNPFGRAHFYAPQKQFGGIIVDTPKFNMFIILLFTFLVSIIALARPIKY